MKVLILGLGTYVTGSGISAAKFLIGEGYEVRITDLKTKKELIHQITEIERFAKLKKAKVKFILGRHNETDIEWADMVVRNPGVPKHSNYLKLAKELGKEIETDISLFFKKCKSKNIIGITGTRGKSTTSTLLSEILKTKYPHVYLGGNIKISPLLFLEKIKKDDVVVLELSSWMLENFCDKNIAPHIAIITNIYPDHLNSYKNMVEYIEAKKNIFACQGKDDYLILNYDNIETKKMRAKSQIYFFTKKLLKNKLGAYIEGGVIKTRRPNKTNNVSSVEDVKLQGEHNLENILAAVLATKLMGVPCAQVRSVLKKFSGLPDRQEIVLERDGITYVNDTTATTPEGTIAALHTFGNQHKNIKTQEYKNIILIAGGKDKEVEYKELAKEIKKYCKAVILFPGTASDKIRKELRIMKYEVRIAEDMKKAVYIAKELAEKGNIILLSPAAASFGLFKNEFDRSEQFRRSI